MKKVLSACAGLALIGVLTLAGAELALRALGYSAPIWYQPDALLGWTMRPGVQGWYTHEGRAYVEVNAAGWRDRLHALQKPAGTYRIAVIGDSVTEALQLDLQQTFWWQLPEKLRGCPALASREIEVLNFGASGYGSAQEALLLESTAIRYQPDLVLLAFAGNDVRDNSLKLTSETDRPFFVLDDGSLKLNTAFQDSPTFRKYSSRPAVLYRASSDHSRLVQLVQKARQGLGVLRQAGNANAATGASPAIAGLEPGTELAVFAPPRDAAPQDARALADRIPARV